MTLIGTLFVLSNIIMKRIRVELVRDEGFVAVTLQEFAMQVADNFVLDEYYFNHGTGIIELYKEEEEKL